MAVLTSSSLLPFPLPRLCKSQAAVKFPPQRCARPATLSAPLCASETLKIDKSALSLSEAVTDEELWATTLLRVRSFYDFKPSIGIEDYKRNLTEREYEALKERVAGTRAGFKRVACINATLPLSKFSDFPDDLSSTCKFSNNGDDRVVIGTLDLNQCISLPDEISGTKPKMIHTSTFLYYQISIKKASESENEVSFSIINSFNREFELVLRKGIGADFARAYLSNVCVAKECQRNGIALALIERSKMVAEDWGISDLYVHVAVDNEAARNLYMKSGFIHENDEPAWQARFLDRPRRTLLWTALPHSYDW